MSQVSDVTLIYARDYYKPAFSTWVVGPVPNVEARDVLIEKHYLHRKANISYAYGAYDTDHNLMAVVSFGSPTSFRVVRSASDEPFTVIELNRLWIDDDAPFGLGSWFLSRALKQLPAYIVVAYADLSITDPRYGTAHDGAIYRACSFNYAGASRPNTEWQLPGKSRNVGKHVLGSVQVVTSPKRRFWTVTGTKADKRRLRKVCKWATLPY